MSYRKQYILFFICISLLLPRISSSQVQVAKVMDGDVELNTIPALTYNWGIPINIMGPYAFMKSQDMFMESGLFVNTNKYIFDRGDTRYSHRTIGISIPLRTGAIIKDRFYVGAGHNFNFPFHYRQNTYDAGGFDNRQQTVSQFFSPQIMKFYPSIELSVGLSTHTIGRFNLRVQMHYLDFFNVGYQKDGIKPYENIVFENRFKFIIISYNPGL